MDTAAENNKKNDPIFTNGSEEKQDNSVKPASKNNLIAGRYRLLKTIGQGTYGKVKLAIDTKKNEKVAVKLLEKANIKSQRQVERIQREIRFLKLLHHPNIVKILDVIETSGQIFIVMEYATGGELFDYIVTHKRVKEKEAREFFRQILSAVDYCHKNAVIHRDLKPENLLLDSGKQIKIIDFGFSNTYKTDALLDTFCGSPFYASPEMILGKKYEGPEVDVWSLGVIFFALLCGHLPFDDDDTKVLYRKISTATFHMPGHLSEPCKYLISRMITVDPKKRATLSEIMNHRWLNEGYNGIPENHLPERKILGVNDLKSSILSKMEGFGFSREQTVASFKYLAESAKNLQDSDKNSSALKICPEVATYYLMSEMIEREKIQRKKLEDEKSKSGNPTPELPVKSVKIQVSGDESTKKLEISTQIPQDLIQKQGPKTASVLEKSREHSLDPKEQSNNLPKNTINLSANGTSTSINKDGEKAVSSIQLSVIEEKDLSSQITNPETPQSSDQKLRIKPPQLQAFKSENSLFVTVPTTRNHARSATENAHSRKKSTSSRAPSSPKFSNPLVAYLTAKRTSLTVGLLNRGGSPTNPSNLSSNNLTAPSENQQNSSIHSLTSKSSNSLSPISTSRGNFPEVRAVSGWFMNVATTSAKPPQEIMEHLIEVLSSLEGIWFDFYAANSPEGNGVGGAKRGSLAAIGGSSLSLSGNSSTSKNLAWTLLVRVDANEFYNSKQNWQASSSQEEKNHLDISEEQDITDALSSPEDENFQDALEEQPRRRSSITYQLYPISLPESKVVIFEIEICRVTRLNLHGLLFKRLQGSIWSYKKVCGDLLPKINP